MWMKSYNVQDDKKHFPSMKSPDWCRKSRQILHQPYIALHHTFQKQLFSRPQLMFTVSVKHSEKQRNNFVQRNVRTGFSLFIHTWTNLRDHMTLGQRQNWIFSQKGGLSLKQARPQENQNEVGSFYELSNLVDRRVRIINKYYCSI